MEKFPLFFNPQAKGAHATRFRQWSKLNRDHFHHIEPSSAQELEEMIKDQVAKQAPIIGVAGGDGTLSHAAQALRGSTTKLGIFPAGTVNVFAKEAGLNRSYDRALQTILQGKSKTIDLFCLNDIPFIQMAGVGPDARTIELTKWQLKQKISALAYGVAAFQMMTERTPTLTLTCTEGKSYQGHAIILGNGRKYAGPLNLFRHAQFNDGYLDALILKGPISRIGKTLVTQFFRGGAHLGHDFDYDYIQIKGGTIKSDIKTPFELDGDARGHTPIHITQAEPFQLITP